MTSQCLISMSLDSPLHAISSSSSSSSEGFIYCLLLYTHCLSVVCMLYKGPLGGGRNKKL